LLGPAAVARVVVLEVRLRAIASEPAVVVHSDARDAPDRLLAKDGEPGAAVEVESVRGVPAVLGRVAPVARALGDLADDDHVAAQQLVGDVGLDRRRRTAPEVDPDQPRALLDRVGTHAHLAADRRARTVGQRGAQLAGGQVEGPAVVATGPGAGELLLAE